MRDSGEKQHDGSEHKTPSLDVKYLTHVSTNTNLSRSDITDPNSPYYKQFLTTPDLTAHPSFNCFGNQGIFIPQASEKKPFFFIPGTIAEERFNRMVNSVTSNESKTRLENTEINQIETASMPVSKESLTFVLGHVVNIEEEISYEVDKFETYLVPVNIKKEAGGNIELYPELYYSNYPQPTNPEQISILKKITNLKNQQFAKKLSDSVINDVQKNQEIIDNMKEETQGYVMFRCNKPQFSNFKDRKVEIKSQEIIIPPIGNSLIISASVKGKNSSVIGVKKNSVKKRPKTHKLKLSAEAEKNTFSAQSTSRFRRLRVDDRTQCWNSSGITCIDTKMRAIPAQILKLSETNAINIPDDIFRLFNQKETKPKSNEDLEPSVSCGHEVINDLDFKDKRLKNNHCRFNFWRYMCSMNNCEFIPQEKI